MSILIISWPLIDRNDLVETNDNRRDLVLQWSPMNLYIQNGIISSSFLGWLGSHSVKPILTTFMIHLSTQMG